MKFSMKRRLFVARVTGTGRRLNGRRLIALPATAATLTLAVCTAALALSSPASAQASPTCGDDVTSAPAGPATVSVATTTFGKVLVVGSGDYAGCSLYVLTSDQVHGLTGAFACSDNTNPLGEPCDTGLWPALLTDGAPIAGPGVNPRLLGTVTRNDMPIPGVASVSQVTYAGQPLYRFFLDKTPGDTQGANLFDPVTSPTGTWYLISPRHGHPATGPARLQLETAPVGGTGSDQTVLAATMNNDFSVYPNASFPVYTLSTDRGRESGHGSSADSGHKRGERRRHGRDDESACQGICALSWSPVLTSTQPEAGPGVDQHAVGTIERADGTRQVTYYGRPLYLYYKDANIQNLPAPLLMIGTPSINGAGAVTPWGVFNTIPPL